MAKQNKRAGNSEYRGERRAGKNGKGKGKANLTVVKPADVDTYVPKQRRSTDPIKARTPKQQLYLDYICSKTITFGIGPYGTGKTYVCVSTGCDALLNGRLDQMILTRPAISVGKDWGLVPGTIDEKFAPYIGPYMAILGERLPDPEYMFKTERIVAMPLELMLGMTFKNCLVILDEAQNTTEEQMEMFLSRIGDNCTVVVNGNLRQVYIKEPSGLRDAVNRIHHLPSVGLVQFRKEDIVRSGIVQEICEAYESPITLKSPIEDQE